VIDVLTVEPQGVLKQAPLPASPCSAAFRYHSAAFTESLGTPSPFWYLTPRSKCSWAVACANALPLPETPMRSTTDRRRNMLTPRAHAETTG
jgi:hypothetical protein